MCVWAFQRCLCICYVFNRCNHTREEYDCDWVVMRSLLIILMFIPLRYSFWWIRFDVMLWYIKFDWGRVESPSYEKAPRGLRFEKEYSWFIGDVQVVVRRVSGKGASVEPRSCSVYGNLMVKMYIMCLVKSEQQVWVYYNPNKPDFSCFVIRTVWFTPCGLYDKSLIMQKLLYTFWMTLRLYFSLTRG